MQELLNIKQKLMSLKFGNDLNIVKNIDERLQRLLVMFDFKPEEDNSGIEDLSLERQEPINVCPEEFKGERIVHLNHYINLQNTLYHVQWRAIQTALLPVYDVK